ncbi:MAG: hypothetical protein CSA84_03270 [Actinomycetales bacterium]|nr:MAG: hypothetical protein CSA84_03270 [Actinomycetales bacterium]
MLNPRWVAGAILTAVLAAGSGPASALPIPIPENPDSPTCQPVLVDDNQTTTWQSSFHFDPRLNDVETCGARPVIVSEPSHGLADTVYDGRLVYWPNDHYLGTDSLEYSITSPLSGLSDTATVTFTVTDPVCELSASPDSYATEPGVPLVVHAPGVLANDSSPCDGVGGKAFSPSHGKADIANDGSFTYTPETGFVGTDEFGYAIHSAVDMSGMYTTVTIDVGGSTCVADANDDEFTASANWLLVVGSPGLLANDTQCDAVTELLKKPLHGDVVVMPKGQFIYRPDPGFVGADKFTYGLVDDRHIVDGATAHIQVEPPRESGCPPWSRWCHLGPQ